MQFVKSETTESFVSRTNALLTVGSLISIGDISVSIATAFLSPGGNLLGHQVTKVPARLRMFLVINLKSVQAYCVQKCQSGWPWVKCWLISRHFSFTSGCSSTNARPTQRHCDMSEYIVSFNNNNFKSKICQKTLSCLENVIALLDYLLHYAFNRL